MGGFTYFVVFADMRTGSNLLESALNALEGVSCHGELFNPHFIGHPSGREVFGISAVSRDRDPIALLQAMRKKADGIPGFRLFQDHDVRVRAHCLADPACAKIILTRNVVDSYVSHAIARATGQWKLSDAKDRKVAQAQFAATEFKAFQTQRARYQNELRAGLQKAGQTAFALTYEDLRSVETLNGLAAYLGVTDRLRRMPTGVKKQNPAPLSEKVKNYDQMLRELASMDRWDVDYHPVFEMPRGPGVPSMHLGGHSGLIFAPLAGGPNQTVVDWITDVDGAAPATGLRQNDLRAWKKAHPGHLSFTVLRHPVARALAVFHQQFVNPGSASDELRASLRDRYNIPLPPDATARWRASDVRTVWLMFLKFLSAQLAGQTSIQTPPEWATQATLLAGITQWQAPDRVLREDVLVSEMAHLANQRRLEAPAYASESLPEFFGEIYAKDIEKAVRKAYARDYAQFGFADWSI